MRVQRARSYTFSRRPLSASSVATPRQTYYTRRAEQQNGPRFARAVRARAQSEGGGGAGIARACASRSGAGAPDVRAVVLRVYDRASSQEKWHGAMVLSPAFRSVAAQLPSAARYASLLDGCKRRHPKCCRPPVLSAAMARRKANAAYIRHSRPPLRKEAAGEARETGSGDASRKRCGGMASEVNEVGCEVVIERDKP